MSQEQGTPAETYYEVEIKKGLNGYTGTLRLVDGKNRHNDPLDLGPVGGGMMGNTFLSRDAVIAAAKKAAKIHDKGPDIVRLNLDIESPATIESNQ